MNSESYRIWRNRNAYAFTAGLSLFIFLDAFPRFLTFKDLGAVIEVMATGFLVIRCGRLASAADVRLWNEHDQVRLTVEDRLDELERLKRRDMVTPEEYTSKRQEILKDL